MEYQGAGSQGFPARTPARGFPPGRRPNDAGFPEGTWAGPPEGAPPEDTAVIPRMPGRRGGREKADGPRPRRRGRPRTTLIAAVVVLVLAAAGFGGYRLLSKQRANAPVPGTLRLPTNAPGSVGSPAFDKALGTWQHIGTRAQDPAPLTIVALYPPMFALNGSSYLRTAASVTKNCSLAVYGAQLQAALQSGHCSQVVRASYISGNGQMMGTIGVANLVSASAAQKAGQATGPQEIIAPLGSRSGATKKLGTGTGVVQAEIKGHYLILMWAEFTNLKSPSTSAARQLLEQFAKNLVTGSANINLSTRMLGSKP